MIKFRQKSFGKTKYPEDWDEDDWKYLDKIDKNNEKRIRNSILSGSLIGTSPSITRDILLKRKKSLRNILVGAGIGALAGSSLSKLGDNTKERKRKYRKIKNKKDREIYRRENKEMNKFRDHISSIMFL